MTDRVIWDMQDIKVIRKMPSELKVELLGSGFGFGFKYPTIKKMEAAFARFEKQWNTVREANKKQAFEHQRMHKKQSQLLDHAKKHVCK